MKLLGLMDPEKLFKIQGEHCVQAHTHAYAGDVA